MYDLAPATHHAEERVDREFGAAFGGGVDPPLVVVEADQPAYFQQRPTQDRVGQDVGGLVRAVDADEVEMIVRQVAEHRVAAALSGDQLVAVRGGVGQESRFTNGFKAYIEWKPESGWGEISITKDGAEKIRYKWLKSDPDKLKVVLNHKGNKLPGLSEKEIDAIRNNLGRAQREMVAKAGGKWTKRLLSSDVFSAYTRAVSKNSLVGRIARRIPIIGAGVILFGWGSDVQAKGFVAGTANSAIDAIPVVGTIKGGVELVTGDLIPDLEDDFDTPLPDIDTPEQRDGYFDYNTMEFYYYCKEEPKTKGWELDNDWMNS